MDSQHYQQLVKRYLNGSATDDELEVFAHLLKEGKLDAHLIKALDNEAGITSTDEVTEPDKASKKSIIRTLWFKYAAAVLLLIGAGATFYISVNKTQPAASPQVVKNDVLPGGNKAVLTLANGKKIVLGSSEIGTIAKQGSTQVEKVEDGQLVYQAITATHENLEQEPTYNMINTPKGGQYTVILPDGSKVWLNSVSSITFPTAFAGTERKVTITGEVYFEVAKNKEKPFIVESYGQKVKVLGTHFNINAYNDERAIRTTLLEGSVQVTANNNSEILAPGQQAEFSNNKITIVKSIDATAAVAWKNGTFVFDNADLPSLMRQLSRWYDVNIIYGGNIGEHEFVGQIKRSAKLSSVLKILAASGVHFTIAGKNLYIQP